MNDLITPRTLDTLEHKIFDEDVPQTDAIPTFLDACLWTTRMVTIQEIAECLEYEPAVCLAMNASDRLAAWTDLIHRQTHPTGPEHPNLYGLSPLTIAALAGNTTRVQELLNAGEHPDTRDEWGFTPVMHALRHAALNPEYATGPFPDVFQHLAPAHLDVRLNGVTRRITRGEGTYLVLLRLLSQIGTVGFATMNLNPNDVDRHGLTYDQRPSGLNATDLTFPPMPAHAPAELRVTHDDVMRVLTGPDSDTHHAGQGLWIELNAGEYMPNPDLLLHTPGTNGREWQSVLDALQVSPVTLPDVYRSEHQNLRAQFQGEPPAEGAKLRRADPKGANAHKHYDVVGIPKGLFRQYSLNSTALWITTRLFHTPPTKKLKVPHAADLDPDANDRYVERTIRKLTLLRLLVPDDHGTVQVFYQQDTTVYPTGRLKALSDNALRALSDWQNWRPVRADHPGVQELRDANFGIVATEATQNEPIPEHLTDPRSQAPIVIPAGTSRVVMMHFLLEALNQARPWLPDGSPVHVTFPGHQVELESVDEDDDGDDNLWGMVINSGDSAPAKPDVVTRAGWWNNPVLAHAQAKTWLVKTEADVNRVAADILNFTRDLYGEGDGSAVISFPLMTL